MLIFESYKETPEIPLNITIKALALNIEMHADKKKGKNISTKGGIRDPFSGIDDPLLESERHYVRRGRGYYCTTKGWIVNGQ